MASKNLRVDCRIAAWSVVCADAETIKQWRRTPGDVGGQALPVSFLRQSEDQSVAALRAVLDAIDRHDLRKVDWTNWGVIAGPTFLGRPVIAQTIQRYKSEGAWCVSPHFIPQQSLHAVSGTISQALKMHGPNFGVNGGANPGPDTLLIAAAMLCPSAPDADPPLPGLWVVLSGHDAELIPAVEGAADAPPRCLAVALALTGVPANTTDWLLSIAQAEVGESLKSLPMFRLGTFAAALPKKSGRWRLSDTHWAELGPGAQP